MQLHLLYHPFTLPIAGQVDNFQFCSIGLNFFFEINAQLLSEKEEEENEMKSKQNVINHIAMVTDYSMIYERLVNKTASTDPFHLLLTCPINKTKTGK
ncbi:hypothetical protein T08_13163 [Trichinella sp. T8]|nr:hypothetical protein T08_13163 [Trichinella sp. T8]